MENKSGFIGLEFDEVLWKISLNPNFKIWHHAIYPDGNGIIEFSCPTNYLTIEDMKCLIFNDYACIAEE